MGNSGRERGRERERERGRSLGCVCVFVGEEEREVDRERERESEPQSHSMHSIMFLDEKFVVSRWARGGDGAFAGFVSPSSKSR